MRPYRGLTKDGEWVYGWYAEIENEHFIIPDDAVTCYPEVGLHSICGFVEVIPETVGQSTGFKDLWKGDKIEGDLFDSRLPTAGEVVFDKEHGCWASKNEGGLTFLFKINNIKVIGNIQQNPELLEKE